MSESDEKPRESVSTPPSILEDIQQAKPLRSTGQGAHLALRRTADDARHHFGRLLDRSDVTVQQYNALRILRGAGPKGLPTLAIADRMIERTPGVTRLMDRMEGKGWVVRERGTEDRRRVWCRITGAGLELLASLDEPVDEFDRRLGAAFSDEDAETLVRLLDRLRAHLGRADF